MKSYAIIRQWFEEIKEEVKHENVYYYNDKIWGEMVEADFDEEQFEKISEKLGWM